MYRRKRHDNAHVAATDDCLRRVAARWKADVDVKQRVADVLDIDALGLDGSDRWYALSAHFDFVVWRNNEPQFAVEFDERHHFTDPAQMVKDERKNAICRKAMFPILRIEDTALKRIGDTSMIEWLAGLWFVYHDLWLPARAEWDEAEGYDPADWDDDLLAEVRRHEDFSYTEFMSSQKGVGIPEFQTPGPFDPFAEARHAVTLHGFSIDLPATTPSWYRRFMPAAAFHEKDPHGREVGYVAVPVGASGLIVGKGRCWNPGFMFTGDASLGIRVATDIALQQAADFLQLYERGGYPLVTWAEAERRLATLNESLLTIATLDQGDHRDLTFRMLRKMGMPPDAARRAMLSLEWDEDGRVMDDDDW